MRRAGGIPFLADLLRAGPQNKASYYAAGAIANVAAFNQPCQDAVREADALQLIIALLQASLAVGVDARWVVWQRCCTLACQFQVLPVGDSAVMPAAPSHYKTANPPAAP